MREESRAARRSEASRELKLFRLVCRWWPAGSREEGEETLW